MGKKKIFILGLILSFSFNVLAQTPNDTILLQRKSYVFRGQVLTPNDMLQLMKDNPSAYQLMKQAKNNNNAVLALSTIGGVFVGFPLGQALGGGKPDWALAAVGGGFWLLSIPFGVAYREKSKVAVQLYNNGQKTVGLIKREWQFNFAPNGLSLALKF
jgi:hypothetical protein